MNITECSTIRDAAVECIERLYEFAADQCDCQKGKEKKKGQEIKREAELERERIQKEITAQMYGVLASVSMDIANEPWKEDGDVNSLKERLFILQSISQLMEDLA